MRQGDAGQARQKLQPGRSCANRTWALGPGSWINSALGQTDREEVTAGCRPGKLRPGLSLANSHTGLRGWCAVRTEREVWTAGQESRGRSGVPQPSCGLSGRPRPPALTGRRGGGHEAWAHQEPGALLDHHLGTTATSENCGCSEMPTMVTCGCHKTQPALSSDQASCLQPSASRSQQCPITGRDWSLHQQTGLLPRASFSFFRKTLQGLFLKNYLSLVSLKNPLHTTAY